MPAMADQGRPEAVTRDVVETSDPERGHHLIALRFREHRARITGPRAGFRYRRVTLRADDLDISETRYTMRNRTESSPYPDFATVTVTHGRYAVRTMNEELHLGPGMTGRYPEVGASHMVDDITSVVVRMPMTRIAAGAAARTGLPVTNFRFTALAPLSSEMDLLWQSVASFARQQLGVDAVLASPLARSGLVDLVANTAVAVFPNTTMTIHYLPGQSDVGHVVVRRAAEFIEAHAAEPLTVGQIAAACEISQRALQAAFRRHQGQSPMAFLRSVRLRQAHRDLRHPEPGQTVAQTARRWGWAHLGRFAQAYHEAYGCHPNETLRAAGAPRSAERDA
ncbi:helix-turn-helix transcriptional regulator [Micromonospora sp. NPDC005298]|uniref:helix-turn-helix transcriptional regulator n=1 Tax=Micromonospora sp. NPDC005298 TaxID=3156873 RepID=UPI0033BAC79B